MSPLSRRAFLRSTTAVAAVLPPWSIARAQGPSAWKIGGFTKTIQDLSFDETARVVADVGWDGIELALRAGGHVLPERVEDDLPRMVSALGARGKTVLVLATDVVGASPLSERVLRAAARANIRRYRLGFLRYREGTSIVRQLADLRARLTDLAALNRTLGMTGLIQNHSGNGYVGAAVWDIFSLIEHLDPGDLGVHFDIGHATVEAGLSWPTAFALVEDRVGAVIVKDFRWTRAPGRPPDLEWCPLGTGVVQPTFFTRLKATAFQGPITVQFEYPFENESLAARVRAFKADHAQLRTWLG